MGAEALGLLELADDVNFFGRGAVIGIGFEVAGLAPGVTHGVS